MGAQVKYKKQIANYKENYVEKKKVEKQYEEDSVDDEEESDSKGSSFYAKNQKTPPDSEEQESIEANENEHDTGFTAEHSARLSVLSNTHKMRRASRKIKIIKRLAKGSRKRRKTTAGG